MNAAAFAVLRGRVGRVATIRPVESALKIEPTPKIAAETCNDPLLLLFFLSDRAKS